MQKVRRDERISSRLCVFAILLLTVGFMVGAAQGSSQDVINARMDERFVSIVERVGKLETAQNYGLGALAANLFAHLLQIKATVRRRRRQQDEDEE